MQPTTFLRRAVALLAIASLCMAWLATATPTRAVSPDVVISQIYGGGGNSGAPLRNDFIELFNRGSAPAAITGWSVQYASATGTSWAVTAVSGTIPPGGYYLVQEAQGANVGAPPLPTPDATGTIPMSATAGKVALVTNAAALACGADCDAAAGVRDFIGYGTANDFETQAAPGLSNTTADIRGANGCTDTDNNSADFTATAPAPRNSATAAAPCPTSTPPTGVGAADPPSVDPGEQTLLSVAVTPGTGPTSTGITVHANLSEIGGVVSQALLDDGSQGDTTPGDGTYSYLATVAADATSGAKAIPFTVADLEGRSSGGTITVGISSGLDVHDIQGAGHVSPYAGQQVFSVDGVVTAVSGLGFWFEDLEPDGDLATSEGLFAFKPSLPRPAAGDHVRVDGTVTEFRAGGDDGFENLALTELAGATYSVRATGIALPSTIVGAGGRLPPSMTIDDDTQPPPVGDRTIDGPGTVTTFDPTSDGIDFYESLEGMRLRVAGALAVGPTNGFGEIAIVANDGSASGPDTARNGVLATLTDKNPERIILDDVLLPGQTPAVNVGDGFAQPIVGVLDYSFANYKLLFSEAPVRADRGLQREVASAPRAREISVATFNVENLTDQDDLAKVDALAQQIVTNLRAPDLIGIEEMQDNSGETDDGTVAANESWQFLIDAIVRAGGPTYSYRQIDPENNADGGVPGGNIRVGFLFRTDTGLGFTDRPGGTATTDTEVVPVGSGDDRRAQLTISPGRIIAAHDSPFADAFANTRKPLVGEFRWNNEPLFVVVNHFSSKGADNPLYGRFQQPVRSSEFETPAGGEDDGWRHGQAQVVNDFVDEVLAADKHARVVVVGDVNDFEYSETVDVLEGVAQPVIGASPDPDGSGATAPTGERPVLTSLFDLLPLSERYSYVFEGNSQVLDQILVSRSVLQRHPTYDVLHVNAEFADQASDHDPSVMRVRLPERD